MAESPAALHRVVSWRPAVEAPHGPDRPRKADDPPHLECTCLLATCRTSSTASTQGSPSPGSAANQWKYFKASAPLSSVCWRISSQNLVPIVIARPGPPRPRLLRSPQPRLPGVVQGAPPDPRGSCAALQAETAARWIGSCRRGRVGASASAKMREVSWSLVTVRCLPWLKQASDDGDSRRCGANKQIQSRTPLETHGQDRMPI